MKLLRTSRGVVVESDGEARLVKGLGWDALFTADDPHALLDAATGETIELRHDEILSPLVSQEVWCAGVTYYRSRDARMEESDAGGGADHYARVYDADRPELFFKGTATRVVGSAEKVRIRADSKWNVPEPELAVAVTARGRIFGYTVGNDMSSRDIEGENPLYLPQAKVYDRCGAVGPGILMQGEPLGEDTAIKLEITRDGATVFQDGTDLSQLKRKPPELVEYLYRDNIFPHGCLLLTGTGIVPSSDFTLQSGDVIRITIDDIGTLENQVM